MKRLLLFPIFSIFWISISAQTNTWTAINGDWNTPGNWSLGQVPTPSHDVIIPTGLTINLNSNAHTKSITVQGNAVLNMPAGGGYQLSFTNASSFSAASTLNWGYATMGGGGTLTLSGTTNLVSGNHKFIAEGTTIINKGTINHDDTGNIYIYDGTLTNAPSGVINLKTASGNISYSQTGSHIFNNEGLIRRTGTGRVDISAEFHNNGGIITVESGTLYINGLKSFLNNGIYNVAADATFQWNTEIECTGTLTGAPQGEIIISTASITIPSGSTTYFNFTGNTGIVFDYVDAIKGSGTLVNNGKITFRGASNKFIRENTTVRNESTINYEATGNFYISDGILVNTSTGIIDLQTAGGHINGDGSSGSHIFNNDGLIKMTGTGQVNISAELHNNGGTISVEGGSLFINGLKSYLDNGMYNVAADATFHWNTEIECTGTLTGAIEGEIIVSTASVTIPSGTTTSFNFTGNTGIIFDYVDAVKGSGALINKGKLTFRGASNKFIRENTSIRNEGFVNYQATGNFYISDGTFTNTASGSFNLQTAGGHIVGNGPGTHLFINEGELKHTSEGSVNIGAELHNEGGTISVESGTLVLNGDTEYLNGGIYNVADGARFHWNTEIVCTGTLTGVLDGDIFCSTSSIKVPAAMTAIFDFTGTKGVLWNYLDITGSGTLVNKGKLLLTSSSNKFIQENTTVRNEGSMNFEGSGTLYITEGELNNPGVIDLQTPYGNISANGTSGVRKLNNTGLIKRTTNEGTVEINVATANSGTIDVQLGVLKFSGTQGFNNTVDGTVMGTGTLALPAAANFTNDGTFSPGGTPGTLTVNGDFKSSATSKIHFELLGKTQGTEYDLLALNDKAILAGEISVMLDFDAIIGDEFIVLTSKNITSCNLPATVTANYDDRNYTFTVTCNPENVTLKLTSIVLGNEENKLSGLTLYPNPSDGRFNIDLGKEYSDVTVQISNVFGQVISLKRYVSIRTIENEINYSRGIYFVKVNTDTGESTTLKIMKQ